VPECNSLRQALEEGQGSVLLMKLRQTLGPLHYCLYPLTRLAVRCCLPCDARIARAGRASRQALSRLRSSACGCCGRLRLCCEWPEGDIGMLLPDAATCSGTSARDLLATTSTLTIANITVRLFSETISCLFMIEGKGHCVYHWALPLA
jgi:hypothetical protein